MIRLSQTSRRRRTPTAINLLLLFMAAAGCGQSAVTETPASSSLCKPNQCQLSGALKEDGSCVYTSRPDGTACDDDNTCTLYDTCKTGVCTAGTVLKDGATCNDKNVCTQTDICQAGVCEGTNLLVCPVGGACTQSAACDPTNGCVLKSYGPCVEGLSAMTLQGCVQSDYTAPVAIGGSVFDLLLDSGSTTIAIAAAQCANCNVSPTYTPGAAAVLQNHAATGAYGDGTGWSGTIYQDTVRAGSATSTYTPNTSMRFAAISADTDPNNPFFTGSTCAQTYNPNAYQGIFGLGPTDLALNYTDSFLDIIGASGTLTYDAFAVNLCNVGGQMWFGGFNPTAVAQAPNFTPMVTKNAEGAYYAVAIDDILVGSTSVGLASDALGPAIVDTGTGAYAMSQTAYNAITTLIAADAGFLQHFSSTFFTDGACVASSQGAAPTAVDAALPHLTMAMPSGGKVSGMQVAMLATESYLQPQISGSSIVYCTTLTPSTSTILGSAAMRGQVVIFDRENSQVGFAAQTSCSSALPYAVLE